MCVRHLWIAIFSALLLALCCLTPPLTEAAELTINQPLSHNGLTFSQPLTFTKTSHIHPATLEFGTTSLIVYKNTKNNLTRLLPTLTPTLILPTPTVIPTLIPTEIIQPTPTALPATPIPTVITNATQSGLNADVLFSMVNNYRSEKGLPPFQKDERTCQLAESRAPEVAAEVASGNMHQGLRDRNLPYWNTENIISMRNEQEAFNWWLNDYIHKKAIESSNTYSCVACSGYNCAEEFTNYQPK